MGAVEADPAAPGDCRRRASLVPSAKLTTTAGLLGLAGYFAILHSYPGVIGDSKIYMGRALADVNPAGVGRDFMFTLDGQSQFSLFTLVARWLVAHFGISASAVILAALGSALWFVAALALARRVAPGRSFATAAVVFAAPAFYGPYRLLSYAETLAEPRPFAEAFVILALAAFLARRLALTVALLTLSAAVHPIMALAGVATVGLVLCVEDRRWLLAAVAATLALVIAVVLDAPMVGRLRVMVDDQWRALLLARNAYLFPNVWPAADYLLPLLQAVTIGLAAARSEGRLRRVLLAALAAGAIGLLVAWIAGAFIPSLLALQAQTWRMWWLTGVIAALSLALCALRLGRGGGLDRFALAMLAFAWTMIGQGPIILVAVALVVFAATPRLAGGLVMSDNIARIAWLGLIAALAVPAAIMLARWFDLPAEPGYAPIFTKRLVALFGELALCGAIMIAAFGAPARLARLPRSLAASLSMVAALAGALLWFDPNSYVRELSSARPQQELAALTPRPGEILWLQGTLELWFWLERPHWLSDVQGAGIVFSRDLAMLYRERADALVAAGLSDASLIDRYADGTHAVIVDVTRAKAAQICGRPDAPAYIVAPIEKDAFVEPALKASYWTPPAVRLEPARIEGKAVDVRIERYAVIDCAVVR